MIGKLLVSGLIAGFIAGVLAFGTARVWGEPSVDAAIALEEAAAAHDHAPGTAPDHSHGEEELVSRETQAGMGLFTGTAVFCTALGGLFALAFAFLHGRVIPLGARATAGLTALAGFVTVSLVPALKYPPNPPAVGALETIGTRTGLYFGLIVASLAAAAIGIKILKSVRLQPWHAAIAGCATYAVLMLAAGTILPAVNEVGPDFPADVLWQFRTASIGLHAVIWTALGLVFGELAARQLEPDTGLRPA